MTPLRIKCLTKRDMKMYDSGTFDIERWRAEVTDVKRHIISHLSDSRHDTTKEDADVYTCMMTKNTANMLEDISGNDRGYIEDSDEVFGLPLVIQDLGFQDGLIYLQPDP